MANFCQWGHKVSRISIVVATPSIFESLILKQIDLHCKAHYNTCITKLYHKIVFWAIGINIT